ncbi:protein kinase (incomplete catalytic triad) [Toxoplasma gondii MAS]|uniref:Protein kinase (Incomplete catalytic triad) n=1 Tax=Toxoplasma gondii MAS TaxID=943118 RepID=A0A086QX29_TOXGO|nr:protein kinase (incomplete catalytic triad) [Toxoplasma gondii MAS]
MRFPVASLFAAGWLGLAVSAEEPTWESLEERGRELVKQHVSAVSGYTHLFERELHMVNAATAVLPLGSVLEVWGGKRLVRGRNVAVTEGAVLFDVTDNESKHEYTAKLFSVANKSVVKALSAVWKSFKEKNVESVLVERFGSDENVLKSGFLVPVGGGSIVNVPPVLQPAGKWSDTSFLGALILYPRVAQTLDALLWSGATLEKAAKFFLIRRLIRSVGDLHRSELCHGNLHPTNIVILAESGDIALTSFGESCFQSLFVLSDTMGMGGAKQDTVRLGNIAHAIYTGKYPSDDLDKCNDNPDFPKADDTDVNDVVIRAAIMRLLCCGECPMQKPADMVVASPLFSS